MAISWIEAPYDWAMYAQFPTAIPRMPSWWPLNTTWGGLPASVPIGYISYFVLPAVHRCGAWAVGQPSRYGWRRPYALLGVGFGVGFAWAFCFNGVLGARLGVFYYGRVIPGLAIFEGTKHQYPIYDAVAMALQMMTFAYLLGRTDAEGRNVIEIWADPPDEDAGSGRSRLSIVAVDRSSAMRSTSRSSLPTSSPSCAVTSPPARPSSCSPASRTSRSTAASAATRR